MKARSRVFVVIGLLFVISLVWYFVGARQSGDLQLIGTIDANEVIVSSRISGRIQALSVDEGQEVKAGQLLATIESDDLQAARRAAEATALSEHYKVLESRATEQQTAGETSSQIRSAEAQLRSAKASLAQAQAQYAHQEADTRRTIALAHQGVTSQQQRDEAATSLDAAKAAVNVAQENVLASEAALKQSIAHSVQAKAAMQTVAAAKGSLSNAEALAAQASVNLDYARIYAPISGKINVRASRQGEVVSPGTAIVTITDLTQTWIYAPLPETQSDSVQVGDSLRVVMPSGATVPGKVIAKSAEGDFATQRDVSRRKRDIKTVRLKLLIDNPEMRYVPGMTAEVYIPKDKLVSK